MWLSHPEFHEFVTENWQGTLHQNPLVNFGLKLKNLRGKLRVWNWSVFGDVKSKLRDLTSRINILEVKLGEEWNEDVARDLKESRDQYYELNDKYLDFLSIKAKSSWLEHGDRNSKFYHATIRARRNQNKMYLEMEDGTYSNDREVIGPRSVAYFSDLLQGYTPPPPVDNMAVIDPLIDTNGNDRFCAAPNEDEVHSAILDMNMDSAPGPDGFTGHFYKGCWEIIKTDLMKVIHGFYMGLQIPTSLSATFLSLLPKVKNATAIDQLRPISLCNFIHKIISRILTTRLSPWLPKIISEEQVGFVPGRSIHENIALAMDLVHDLNERAEGGNVIIKLDMSKAFDRVSWSFILAVMRRLGFAEKACDLIFRCISNCHYSIKWDGQTYGFFKSTQGVRQGDPLSPTLFILIMEWFSRTLNGAVEDGYIKPYKVKRGNIIINHLLFADDMLIFTNGAKDSIKNLISLVEDFGYYSGQRLNAAKSVILFSKHIDQRRKDDLLNLSGFAERGFPIIYLGVPLFRGRVKLDYFQTLEQRILDRIKEWAKKFISMGGRVALINSVLNSIGIHNMMVLPIPVTTLKRITSLISGFIWDNGEAKRRHWVDWDNISMSKKLGGLGIKKPDDIRLALHGKLAWRFVQRKTLWARFAHERFREEESGSPVWNSFRHLLKTIREDTYWKVGEGQMTIRDMCERVCWKYPAQLGDKLVRDVICTQVWDDLIEGWPWSVRDHMRRSFLSNMEPSLAWLKASDGVFTTKLFWESFQTKGNTLPWANRLWKSYIPPKIACFIWKVIHNAIPTDDNIASLHICIISKCVCCVNPMQETRDHLLFSGSWAKKLWRSLADLFDKPMIGNMDDMVRVWFDDSQDDFVSHLGSLTAAAGLWEIWKARNSFLHENKSVDWMRLTLAWATKSAFLIKKPFKDDLNSRQLLQHLRIPTP